jgi:hypothetical protein
MHITDAGFSKGAIFEGIVSTSDSDGKPNAAPMGVRMENDQTLSLTIFNTSHTSRHLKATQNGVVNLTTNVEAFYKSAFKEANPKGQLPQEWFAKAQAVDAPKLGFADASVEFSVSNIDPVNSEKSKFSCRIESIKAAKKAPQIYCRAMSATLEAIVHATRVKAFAQDKSKQAQVEQLLALIANCQDVVNRTAPNSQYSAVMEDLTKRIDSWRSKQ